MDLTWVFWMDLSVGALIVILGIPLILEKVKPNSVYGFRTVKTMSDEKIWYPANKYSGKLMIITGMIMILASAILLCTNFGKAMPNAKTIVPLVALAVMLIPIIFMIIASVLYLKKL